MVGDKLRFRFSKTGDLRWISHLDLMRCLERMLRRALIPFKSTQGFHPTPRLSLTLALPLGVAGRCEVAELELVEPRDSLETLNQLNSVAPIGLQFTSVSIIPMRQSAMARRVVYRLPLEPDAVDIVRESAATFMAASSVWVPRLRPRPRQVNIKPYIRGLDVENQTAVLDFWVTPYGTARADEVVQLLGEDLLALPGKYLERTDFELHDEITEETIDGPPEGLPELAPWEQLPVNTAGKGLSTSADPRGGTPVGPVVE